MWIEESSAARIGKGIGKVIGIGIGMWIEEGSAAGTGKGIENNE